MTLKRLRFQIYIILVFLLLIVAAGIMLGTFCGTNSALWHIYKTIIPITLALPTAWLAFCFQRRNSYLKALRDFWGRLLPTIQNTITFAQKNQPTSEEYELIVKDFIIIIDDLRSVFKNINEKKPNLKEVYDEEKIGKYPFEPLKYILLIIFELDPSKSIPKSDKIRYKNLIVRFWKHTHNAILQEFDRNTPTLPVSPYLPIANYEIPEEIKKLKKKDKS